VKEKGMVVCHIKRHVPSTVCVIYTTVFDDKIKPSLNMTVFDGRPPPVVMLALAFGIQTKTSFLES
jgi:hypothetical protein